tara:strand:- start:516 stop:1280 length:765 start_codon:yes stop_codon:yes gene_type:complete
MSVYNDESFVSEAIESILNQSYKDFEFIIIDDFSNDKTKDIIKLYEKKDPRIKAKFNKKNIGLTPNLNYAVSIAKGSWIVRQDSDDVSLKDRLKDAYCIIQKHQFDFYSTPAKAIFKTKNKVIPGYFTRTFFNENFLKFKNPLIHGTLIIKKNILINLKYDESYTYSQDFKLYHDLLNNGFKLFYNKNSITYLLRIHKNQLSNLKNNEQLDFFNKTLIFYGFKKQNLNVLNRFKNKIKELTIILNDFIRRSLSS